MRSVRETTVRIYEIPGTSHVLCYDIPGTRYQVCYGYVDYSLQQYVYTILIRGRIRVDRTSDDLEASYRYTGIDQTSTSINAIHEFTYTRYTRGRERAAQHPSSLGFACGIAGIRESCYSYLQGSRSTTSAVSDLTRTAARAPVDIA